MKNLLLNILYKMFIWMFSNLLGIPVKATLLGVILSFIRNRNVVIQMRNSLIPLTPYLAKLIFIKALPCWKDTEKLGEPMAMGA